MILEGGAKGPGIFFVNPCTDQYRKVDLRTVSFDVPPQEILTKDSVTVQVDAVVYYRVFDPSAAVTNVENASKFVPYTLHLFLSLARLQINIFFLTDISYLSQWIYRESNRIA
jgi:regulator of protease activity HflC (stomatin/prohibitin superfamily)